MSILTSEDQIHFKDWLELNLVSISWEGRFLTEFNMFWEQLFQSDIEISTQFEKLTYIKAQLREGPLISWFSWVRDKFLCFVFLNKEISISDLALVSSYSESDISLILRNFFIDRFPHLEEIINEELHMGNILATNKKLKFSELSKSLDLDLELDCEIRGSSDDDILASLEVTLYSEWKKIVKLVTQNKNSSNRKIIKKGILKRQLKFIKELVVLFFIGGMLIFLIKLGNKWYEEHLVKKISIFEPSFFWLDKNLSFKSELLIDENEISISSNELEKLEEIESQKVFKESAKASRFEVESDVVLTSVDSLPKDFNVVDLEKSNYEEVSKGGYRNMRYGRRKAYRVMMTSVTPKKTKKEIIKYLNRYKVKQVDNVKPGTEIPGGMYFNLYVPFVDLKEFLSKVSSVQESTILESKTVIGGPSGTTKVFIWVKSI
jgi:hypothetical protein